MTRHHARCFAVTFTLLVILVTRGFAQTPVAENPVTARQVLSTNPLTTILIQWYNGEYERQVRQNVTLGLSASRLGCCSGDAFFAANAAVRFYPGGTALQGFYLGPRIGIFNNTDPDDTTGSLFGVGLELGYAWLMGAEQHLSVSLGGGATRLSNGDPLPMIRIINIGWAF